MASFEIEGGVPLRGEITPQGAKNESLQILCAVVLTPEPVVIRNLPDIRDTNKLIELLGSLGVKVEKLEEGAYRFQADTIDIDYIDTPAYAKQASALRGSIMLLGPLLARFGRGRIPKPGGDKIGRRRLDTHFEGLEKLNARFSYNAREGYYHIDGTHLEGTYMLLDEASVTGTANIVMAAVLARGRTQIYNA
ncbi:MAG: UDP-N-acetylglucosamine 1-carboxyvinyltransferase, partial [Catalinimonas sp.]